MNSTNFSLQPTINKELGYCLFAEENDDNYEKCDSFSGRGYCFINLFVNSVGIVLRPLAYLVSTVANLIFAIFNDDKEDAYTKLSAAGHSFVNIFISPFGQVIKTVRAACGLIHPGAYFDED